MRLMLLILLTSIPQEGFPVLYISISPLNSPSQTPAQMPRPSHHQRRPDIATCLTQLNRIKVMKKTAFYGHSPIVRPSKRPLLLTWPPIAGPKSCQMGEHPSGSSVRINRVLPKSGADHDVGRVGPDPCRRLGMLLWERGVSGGFLNADACH
jgi:hypothetical protein